MRERELKLASTPFAPRVGGSLPMRERELKQRGKPRNESTWSSLPMRERELKPTITINPDVGSGRSPCGSVN